MAIKRTQMMVRVRSNVPGIETTFVMYDMVRGTTEKAQGESTNGWKALLWLDS